MNEQTKNIRCANDLALYARLQQESDVQRINRQITRQQAKNTQSIRRNLLATSVRLTPKMAPEIDRMARECIELLGVELPVELYVYSSAQFNAACFKPEQERLHIMFSSSLLEGFDLDELKFVMGHELGHHVYDHHAIPIGYLLNGKQRPDPELALSLFAWSRYAEISADRAGAHCARDMDAVARALFKLSSGLTSKKIVRFSLDDFVGQVDDMQMHDQSPGQGAPQADWFSTHPFSPLRVKALKLFEQSALYNPMLKMSKGSLEDEVQSVMRIMEPNYLEGKTEQAKLMKRLLFSALVCIAAADGDISDKERTLFAQFFGKYAFKDTLNVEKIKNNLANEVEQVRATVSETEVMQVLRDLCLMVNVDSVQHNLEVALLLDIAKGLHIDAHYVEKMLYKVKALD